VTATVADELPSFSLFAEVVGQDSAVSLLRQSSRAPVHAYLVTGPGGVGERELSRGFAAALLCPSGGCGQCDTCRRVLSGVHPDLIEMQRTGAALRVPEAQEILRLAQRRPFEARRQVLVIGDVHLARLSAPVLLKTLEEPPSSTFFVLLSEGIPPELETLSSRCMTVELGPVPRGALVEWLGATGVPGELVEEIADASSGSLDRARLLAGDPSFAARLELWRSVPDRLDGSGSVVASVAGELMASVEEAVGPLRTRHRQELEVLTAAPPGERSASGRKEMEDRHRREERRWRTDALRAGLAILAGAYRDQLVADATDAPVGTRLAPMGSVGRSVEARWLAGAVSGIERAAAALIRNPNETLLLEALLVRLSHRTVG
jgi:DNA polymerase-3 subunit delta'